MSLSGDTIPLTMRQPSPRIKKESSIFKDPNAKKAEKVVAPKKERGSNNNASVTVSVPPPKPLAAPPESTATPAQQLEWALTALMAVHREDVAMLNTAMPGFSLGEKPSRELLLRELERLAPSLGGHVAPGPPSLLKPADADAALDA